MDTAPRPLHSRRCILGIGIVVLVIATLGAPWPAGATLAGSNGKIAYNSGQGFWVANADGSDPVRLLARQAWGGAQFSPDGTLIAFESYWTTRKGKTRPGVFVMGSDGSGVHRVAGPSWVASEIAWSPDGNWIAFEDAHWGTDSAGREVIYSSISVVHPDGTGLAALTGQTERNCLPSWSPDSQRMVFERGTDQTSVIMVMNADGSNQLQISDGEHYDMDADWSPNGDKIAFVRRSNSGSNTALALMAPDGSGLTLITDMRGSPRHPIWSPDGQVIAYKEYTRRGSSLWVISPDGTGARAITGAADQNVDWSYEWSPDSSSIAFTSHGDLHVTSRDSGVVTPLTNTAGAETLTDWQRLAP
jgi:Tol biopolymer transport system component